MWLSALYLIPTSKSLSLLLLLCLVVLVHLCIVQIVLVSRLLCAVTVAVVCLDSIHDFICIRILKMCNVK